MVDCHGLLPSRIDTLDAPKGAARFPLVVVLILASIVAATWLVGRSGFGWLGALLVPMLAMTAYILWNTIQVMIKKEGEED